MEELKRHIETIINNTFLSIDNVYKENQETRDSKGNPTGLYCPKTSRLFFPKYRDSEKKKGSKKKDTIRISEQELRFLFIEEFNKYIDSYNKENHDKPLEYYYSIETPTEKKYVFKDNPKRCCPDTDNEGVSAQFDLVISDKNKNRVCLIEFKNNSRSTGGEHEKDFLKLSVEGEGKLCYFISIAQASNSDTIDGIIKKLNSSRGNKNICLTSITYICHCLNNRGKKEKKGFDTIYDGITLGVFGWQKCNIYNL